MLMVKAMCSKGRELPWMLRVTWPSPKQDIAYKNLDLKLAKRFRTPWGHELQADLSVFNVFDWVNRTYSTWGAGSGANPPLEENGTIGYARSFQAGLKYRF